MDVCHSIREPFNQRSIQSEIHSMPDSDSNHPDDNARRPHGNIPPLSPPVVQSLTEFQSTGDQKFPAQLRLKKNWQFRNIYGLGQRAGDDHLLIFAATNDQCFSRIGLSVSRKHGSAPTRNRKKRRLRQAFRTIRHQIPAGLDLVLVPRQRNDSSVSDYQSSLLRLTQKLARRISADSNTHE